MQQLDYEEQECPVCGIMAPAKQIENLGQCERHEIEAAKQENSNGEEVDHGISIIENEWKPRVEAENGGAA